ncbi:MAG TPA: hypothetical protein VHD36_11235 [Pirellulales bacterium]|nr:hypothetical protein [Pirellulales bacterium]
MIGKTIETAPRLPWGTIFWLAVGGTMIGASFLLGNRHWAVAAAAPILLGLALLWARGKPLHVRVTETGLETGGPLDVIPYESLEMLSFAGGDPLSPKSTLYVYHQRGILALPADLSVDRGELQAFLAHCLATFKRPRVPANLAGYLADQQAKFGGQHVWTYGGRNIIRSPRKNLARTVLGTLALTGLVWIVAGAVMGGHETWIGAGIICGLLFGLLFLATLARPAPPLRIKNWRDACLVISPLGIALSQGDTHGQMRWSELRDMKLIQPRGTPVLLRLNVAGAQILLPDIYDAPLATIHQQMRDYWRRP